MGILFSPSGVWNTAAACLTSHCHGSSRVRSFSSPKPSNATFGVLAISSIISRRFFGTSSRFFGLMGSLGRLSDGLSLLAARSPFIEASEGNLEAG